MRPAFILLAFLLSGAAPAADDDVSPAALKTAVKKGLDLLEKPSPTFRKKGGCNSCHNQMLPAAAQAFARARGIPTGEIIAQLAPELSEITTERTIEYSTFGPDSVGYELFATGAANRPADAR